MKLKIAAFIFWAGGMATLLTQTVEPFQVFFFGLLLTIATLMIFAVKAFLTGGGDVEGPEKNQSE